MPSSSGKRALILENVNDIDTRLISALFKVSILSGRYQMAVDNRVLQTVCKRTTTRRSGASLQSTHYMNAAMLSTRKKEIMPAQFPARNPSC